MGFLGFGGGGDATVQLLLDRQDVVAGGTVQATVRVAGGRKDTEISEGRLRLVCENEYRYQYMDRNGTHTATATERKVVEEHGFLPAGAVAADTPSEHGLVVLVPADAPPSGEGKITRVRWKAQATLARPHARDVSDEVALEVLSRADQAWVAPAEEIDSHGECELSLVLSKRAFGAREAIEGTLVVKPATDCEVDELRVELEREERVSRNGDQEETVREASAILAGELELSPGLPIEHSFRVEVPPDPVPTLQTDRTSVRWRLRGIGSRRLRSDYNVTQEVLVYSAPGRV